MSCLKFLYTYTLDCFFSQENGLIAHHYIPESDVLDIITKINIDPENPKKMTYIVKDVASSVELIQTLDKQ